MNWIADGAKEPWHEPPQARPGGTGMSEGTKMSERHEMKLVRKKYKVTVGCHPEYENARHIAMVFGSVPGDARMESLEQSEDGTVTAWFVEEQIQP